MAKHSQYCTCLARSTSDKQLTCCHFCLSDHGIHSRQPARVSVQECQLRHLCRRQRDFSCRDMDAADFGRLADVELTTPDCGLVSLRSPTPFRSSSSGPIAGAAADRWDDLTVVKTSQIVSLVQATVLYALTAAGHMNIWLLVALTAFRGIVAAFNQRARLAIVPSLVSEARGLQSTSLSSNSRFIGPMFAGLVTRLPRHCDSVRRFHWRRARRP